MLLEIPPPHADLRRPAGGRRPDSRAPARQCRTACGCSSATATASPSTAICRTGSISSPASISSSSISATTAKTSRSTPANHTYEQLSRDLERVYQDVTAKLGTQQVGRHLPFHVGPHRHEACPRNRLSLGRARAVRSAQRAAARPSGLCRHGGVRGAADGVRQQPPHPFRQRRRARRRLRQVAGRPGLGAGRARADGALGAAEEPGRRRLRAGVRSGERSRHLCRRPCP